MNGKHKELLKTAGIKLMNGLTTAAIVVGILAAFHLLPTDFVSKSEFEEYKTSHDKWAIAKIETFQNQINDLKEQVRLLRGENEKGVAATGRVEEKIDRLLTGQYRPRIR